MIGCVLNPYSVKIGEVSANRADRGCVNTYFLTTVLALMKALAVQRRSGKEFLTSSQPKVSNAFGNYDFRSSCKHWCPASSKPLCSCTHPRGKTFPGGEGGLGRLLMLKLVRLHATECTN